MNSETIVKFVAYNISKMTTNMKTYLISLIIMLMFIGTLKSQSNKVYSVQEVTWFGIDYSQALFIGKDAFEDTDKLQNELQLSWNSLVFTESRKYDISKSFNKSTVYFNTSYINSRNSNANVIPRITNDWTIQRNFNIDTIQDILTSYNYSESNNKTEIGIVFIVQSLNKLNREAIYWITFFDIKTKKGLLTRQVFTTPGGAGIRNYWANSFYKALLIAENKMGFVFN